ncbi:MAG: CapA family protein [Minisyncoccia bacterium]
MAKIKNIIILLLIVFAAIFSFFQNEIADFLKLILSHNNFYSAIEPPKFVSGLFVGDLMLSRGVAYQIEKNNDLYYPFHHIKELLLKNDFVFANLESPIIDGRKIKSGEMVFRADEKLVPILKELNFSIFSLANNHIFNFGEKGLLTTMNLLNKAQILAVGAGSNENEAYDFKIIERNGIKFAFLAYNDMDVAPLNSGATENHAGTALINLEKMRIAIQKARNNADFVIVSLHAGNEYQFKPNDSQIITAHYAIDNGADLVIGHHPHIIQPIEKYKNSYIFYSLGNFVFDQMWSSQTREAIAVRIIFTPSSIKTIQIWPILIENYSQPRIINSKSFPENFSNIVSKLSLPDNKFVIIDQ